MRESEARGAAVPRRGVLKALALAPATIAACAGARAERPAAGEKPRSVAAADGGGSGAPDAALAAIRAVRVPPDAEPAFVFRAAARPGEL